jgi:hypothetical protein
VTLTWAGGGASNCTMSASGDSITRNPNFTLTGPRGGTLTVTKTGTIGQKIERGSAATSLTYTNDGINRKIAKSGTTLYDFTTSTTSGITITGNSRTSRVLSGGGLQVVNNLKNVTCTVAPTAVTWTSTCTCATSGTWSGTCSDGKSYSLEITGCGTARLTASSATADITFDRCESV